MEPPIRSPALPSPMGWVSGGLSCWPCREKHWVGCEAVLLGVGMCHLPCVTALRHWHCLLLPAVLVERAAPALGGAAALFFCFCLFCFVLFVLFCFYRFIFCKLSEPALQPVVLGTYRRAAATLQVSISIPSAPGCDSIHPLGTPMPMSCPALPAPCRETWTGSTAWQHLSISPGAL